MLNRRNGRENRFSREGKGTWRNLRSPQRMQREMNEIAVKDAIRALDMRHALEFYGLQFNRQRFAICPFHSEKTASFRVKGTFWHCFGCGATGDLIDFMRKMFGLSYPDAIDTICKDFGIVPTKITIADQERIDRIRLERYNITRQYEELIECRGQCVERYLAACDRLEEIKQNSTAEFDAYADAHFAVMTAQEALERAERECSEYLCDHPDATPKAHHTRPAIDDSASNGYTPDRSARNKSVRDRSARDKPMQLPPAPKWHGSENE